jgi:O-antigen/teichoic acid export membrane protein
MNSNFSTKHLSGDLKRLSVRAGAATFAGQGAKFVLNLGSTMVLARILSPQDFGLIAMVTAVTGFIMVFKDLGLSMATVQQAEINHSQVSTLFWINIGLSAMLMVITLALAPAVAWFYKDPRLVAVTAALSTGFLFGGLTVQHQALLRRQMRLSAVSIIDVLSMAAGVLTAILCAWAGMGYWALVWMPIATAVTNAIGVWVASGWVPGRPVRRSGVRAMLKFGGWMTGYSLLNYFSRNFDNILIGRFWGPQVLGIYAKAYSLLLLPMGQITAPMTAVAIPALSRLQNEPDRFRSYYLRAVKLIAYISMPGVVIMVVLSREIILLFLGNQWLDAVPIFMVLGISAVLDPAIATVGWVYVSLGRSRRMLAWAAWAAPLRVLSFVIGLPWGAFGVATAYAIGSVILLYPNLAFSLKPSSIKPSHVLASIYRPFAMSAIMALTMVPLRTWLQNLGIGSIAVVAIITVAGGLVFLIQARMWRSAWKDMNDIVSAAKLVFPSSSLNEIPSSSSRNG